MTEDSPRRERELLSPPNLSVADLQTQLLAAIEANRRLVEDGRRRQDEAWRGFLTVWQTNRDYLHAVVRRWSGGSTADVEDVLSDVVIRAGQSYAAGPPVENAKAWLSRLAYNRCADMHRRRARELQRGFVMAPPPSEDDEAPQPADEKPTPEAALLNAELGGVLKRALAHLPSAMQGPAMMRLVDGESYEAVAQAFNLSLANARKRIQTARRHLQGSLEAYHAGTATMPRAWSKPTPVDAGRQQG